MLDHTPVLWAYCPRMMVALAGQQSGLETKAFEKLMPLVFSTERVFGMYLRSSLRMSSARMKTMLGLAVSTPIFLRLLHEMPKESSTTKATQANGKTIFLIPSTPLYRGGRKEDDQTRALLTIAPSYRILSIEAGGAGAQPPCSYLSQARWAYLYARWLFLGANFVELRLRELRRITIPRTSVNKLPVTAPHLSGWHHGCCCPTAEQERHLAKGQEGGSYCVVGG